MGYVDQQHNPIFSPGLSENDYDFYFENLNQFIFSDSDKRKAASFYLEYPDRTTGETVHWYEFTYPPPHITKYREPEHFSGNQNNIRVLRFADVLLVAAEATNESEGPENALQYVNSVRARAGIPYSFRGNK